jgi:hypothetical protein
VEIRDIVLPDGVKFFERAASIVVTENILSIRVDDRLWTDAMQALPLLTPCKRGISLIVIRSETRSIRITTKTLIAWKNRQQAI